jgi:hypothetical protein
MEILQLDPELIEVVNRLRALDSDYVEMLAASIGERGLDAPIRVTAADAHGRHRLIAGAHRLAAVRLLGLPTIAAIPFDGSELQAQLLEVEENLMRRELSEMDRATFLAHHKALWLALYPKVWWDVSQPEDLVARAERDTKVRGLGYRPRPDYIAETYGDGWEPDAPRAPAETDLPALFAEAGRRARARMGAVVPEVALAEQLGPLAQAETDGWLDRIAAITARASSLEEIAAEMLRLYPQLQTDGLAEVMSQALSVAHLTGRGEIADGLR